MTRYIKKIGSKGTLTQELKLKSKKLQFLTQITELD